MSKVFGLFLFKYAQPQLPWELQSMIVFYLRSTIIEYALSHKKIWDWYHISRRISMEYVDNYPELPWDKDGLALNLNINVDFAKRHKVNFSLLSANPAITLNDIIRHPEITWNKLNLSYNPNINMKYLLRNDGFPELSPNLTPKNITGEGLWTDAMRNPNFTLRDILNLTLLHSCVSAILYLTFDYENNLPVYDKFVVQENGFYIRKDVSLNPNFYHPCSKSICWNPNMNLSNLKELPENMRDWYALSSNPGFSLGELALDYPWNYNGMSQNTNITLEFVMARKDKPWNITKLILNRNLSSKDKLIICKKLK